MAYGATPAYLVGWVPFVVWLGLDLIGAAVLIGALVSIWALVVTIIGLRELHGITTGRAVAACLLLVVLVLVIIFSFFFSVLAISLEIFSLYF